MLWDHRMKRYLPSITLLLLTTINPAVADCIQNHYGDVVCGGGQCVKDEYGKVLCATIGGGAIRDSHGAVKCGVGYCAKDSDGQVWCSTIPGGGAAVDAYGKVKCYKGCSEGLEARCEKGE